MEQLSSRNITQENAESLLIALYGYMQYARSLPKRVTPYVPTREAITRQMLQNLAKEKNPEFFAATTRQAKEVGYNTTGVRKLPPRKREQK